MRTFRGERGMIPACGHPTDLLQHLRHSVYIDLDFEVNPVCISPHPLPEQRVTQPVVNPVLRTYFPCINLASLDCDTIIKQYDMFKKHYIRGSSQ
ncbi:hypothetical protein PoB_001194500 [Plakobranchus ocellatus]|uniref:Uncharacterized protein n=1 Tax=Plakobranchus ocellatus TaxID=259542 RepID=A0AAV3YRP8_9GAST|nr:hypothetical protein PoB_001194500 [Plakobranchus ocellatus]